ncbi:flagellar biosynthesis protein FlhF [Aliikangiella sp. IMCC44359]|uniref:flagellar biosynthesis protein FlhF n=1 Tax=Aliikangiella sp. IMCC44359 TaxID=3459125 RepID=UPI00403AD9E5
MKIRRFYGNNIRTALRLVTEEFGEDAAILSNKKVAGGVEVIAALDYDADLMPTKIESANALPNQPESIDENNIGVETVSEQPKRKSTVNHQSTTADLTQSQLTEHSKNLINRLLNQETKGVPDNKAELNQSEVSRSFAQTLGGLQEENSQETLSAPNFSSDTVTPLVNKTQVEWSLDPSLQAMKEELGLMRSMMSEQLKGIAWNRYSESDPVSAMIMRRLSKLGLDSEILNSLLPYVKNESDSECAWQHILAVLAKSLPVANSELIESGGIFAFMGPTGVGKTTSIAKLAARYVIKHGIDSVALITTDNYRISAQEQLASFGKILQLPTTKVSHGQSLDEALNKFADKRLILIDTAGISSSDEHLTKPLEMIQSYRKPIKKLLLMSATSQGRVLQQCLSLFGTYSPDGIIVTKLDEAASLGELLSVVIKANIPMLYTTDGQRIPEDIRIARSHHLVSKMVWLANKYDREIDDWALAQSIEQARSA